MQIGKEMQKDISPACTVGDSSTKPEGCALDANFAKNDGFKAR